MTVEETGTLAGVAASPGRASGRVHVLGEGDSGPIDDENTVLVATDGTPDITPQVLQADAVVLENGSMSAHVVKVCREFATPCVIQIDSATETMAGWEQARVESDRGEADPASDERKHWETARMDSARGRVIDVTSR